MDVVCGLKELNFCFEVKNENLEIKNYKHVFWKYDIRHHNKQMRELKTLLQGMEPGYREEWNREAFSCPEPRATV